MFENEKWIKMLLIFSLGICWQEQTGTMSSSAGVLVSSGWLVFWCDTVFSCLFEFSYASLG